MKEVVGGSNQRKTKTETSDSAAKPAVVQSSQKKTRLLSRRKNRPTRRESGSL
jgi:hypothetical protein